MSYKSSVTMAELKEAQATYKKLQLLQEENAERIEKLEQLFEEEAEQARVDEKRGVYAEHQDVAN